MSVGDTVRQRIPLAQQGIHRTIDSSITYKTIILSPSGLDHDLSLIDFYREDSVQANPKLAGTVSTFLKEAGVKRAFGPTIRFSRTIARPEQLRTRIMLPDEIPLFRNVGLPSDAVTLPEPGDAMIMSGAGCALIVMVCGDTIVAGHGGRDSLIDRNFVLKMGSNDGRSIVDTMAGSVSDGKKLRLLKASCRAFYNVPRKCFDHFYDHERHGVYNQELAQLIRDRHGTRCEQIMKETSRGFYLDQGQLIGAQAIRHSFHTVSTCLEPLTPGGEYAHTRHRDEKMREKRNLIAVVRIT
ncbi:MAG: hypothetical protein AAB582_02860 [Patescibacteria group bacterium]